MPKMVVSLGETSCSSAKSRDKPYKKSDGGGLYLWITPAGNKIWRMKYRFPKHGKEKTLVFGEYPAITLSEAREKRAEARKLLVNGIDPMAVKKRATLRFTQRAKTYF